MISRRELLMSSVAASLADVAMAQPTRPGKMTLSIHQNTSRAAGYRKSLEGWAKAGDLLFLPAVGRHEVLVVDTRDWREVGRIALHGQPVFAVARPDGRQVWVNFAHPLNDTVQVIDVPSLVVVQTLTPGKAVMHLEFSPRGEQVWISVRDEDRVDVYDTARFARLASIAADKPSGIFLTARANRTGF